MLIKLHNLTTFLLLGEFILIIGILASLIVGFILIYAFNQFQFRDKVHGIFIRLGIKIKEWLHPLKMKLLPQKSMPLVWCSLGDKTSEKGENGLSFIEYHGDGKAVKELIGRQLVRRTNNKEGQHYIYFAFTENQADQFRQKPIVIEIEYLDRDKGLDGSTTDDGKRGLSLQYDSVGAGKESSFKHAGEIFFTKSDDWKWVGFNINNANFQRRQQHEADFRLACRYPNKERDYDIYTRCVVVRPRLS